VSFLIRWDRAERHYCQHQKSWLIDAGTSDEIAFVGGINLGNNSVADPGHAPRERRHTHDVYLELVGPCASDVHHNFVQRWNEASDRNELSGCWPSAERCDDLPFPTTVSAKAGAAVAQVQRTVRAGRYSDGRAAPGGRDFAIAKGEFSIFDQYEAAIAAARRYIYLENQTLGQPETVEALHKALTRGVEVVVLTPADPQQFMTQARQNPRSAPFFERLGALAEHDNFALAGIASPDLTGAARHVYVHAKIALIDDSWATIGSCNIGARSFFGDTELNVSFWDPDVVRTLRCELLLEHLGIDTAHLEDRTAMRRYREIAQENAVRKARGEDLCGLAFALNPKTYGL
jgi:cardiolipin synthase A/B